MGPGTIMLLVFSYICWAWGWFADVADMLREDRPLDSPGEYWFLAVGIG